MTLAVVTGGESGIGAACAVRLAQAGADIVIGFHNDRKAADEIVASIRAAGRRGKAIQCDVGKEEDVIRLFDAAEEFGAAGWLVNSAGVNMSGDPIEKMSLEQFQKTVTTDLTGSFLTCREFIRRVDENGGRIVNISSIHEFAPRSGATDYDAAKGGLAQLTRTLALELAPKKVAVNGVAPGMILTPLNARAMADTTYLAEAEAQIAVRRVGLPADVAHMVVFLCSEQASYCNGGTYLVDGGWMLDWPPV